MTEPSAPSNDNGPMKAPPATFEFLAQTMFTQALMAFGKIPNPITKEKDNICTPIPYAAYASVP